MMMNESSSPQNYPALTPRGPLVRRAVNRYSPYLGSLRYIERCYAPWWVFIVCVIAAIVLTLFLAPESRGRDYAPLSFGVALTGFTLLAVLYGNRKYLVFDHGMVVGWFMPWTTPCVFSWTQVDPTSIRAFTRFRRARRHLRKSAIYVEFENTVWLRSGVTLIGPKRTLTERWPGQVGGLFSSMLPDPWRQVWLLGVTRKPERLIHAVTAAMVHVGVPRAADIPLFALPTQKLCRRAGEGPEIPGNRAP